MGLFGKKTGESGSNDKSPGASEFSPEKARLFFERAATVDETGNFEYAVSLWLQGLNWDPSSMAGTEGFFASIARFLNDTGGKKTVGKDVYKMIDGKTDVHKYLQAILEWGHKPQEAAHAVRAFEAAAKVRVIEPAHFIGIRAFGAALREKKVRKDLLMKCMESFNSIGAYDQAIAAAEQAYKVDPSDGELGAHIRSLAAKATMNRGGYEQTGQAGGFRANIRDADKQRQLEEGERIVKTEETVDRLIADAKAELVKRPGDLPTIDRLAKNLLERGRGRDEEEAHTLYLKTFESSAQFRYREMAGQIRVRQSRRKTAELRKMLEGAPGNEMLERMLAQAQDEQLKLEASEIKLQVENYPTDLSRKFELGRRFFELGQSQEAIELFQESQNDPKNRAASLHLLGQAFLKIGWNDEGVGALRAALEIRDVSTELQLEMRYWLMAALQAKAEGDRDLDSAVEADKLASSIAMQQIGYRDIRARRDAIKKILGDLRGNKPAGA